MSPASLLLGVLAAWAAPAPRDVAVIVGSRAAWTYEGCPAGCPVPDRALQYTDLDAWRAAWYLTGTGRVAPSDVRVLTAPAPERAALFGAWTTTPPTSASLRTALTELLDVDAPVRLWIVYSGHGVEKDPSTVHLAFEDRPVPLAEIRSIVGEARAGREDDEVFLVADACRSAMAKGAAGDQPPQVVASDWGQVEIVAAADTPEEPGFGGRLSMLALSAFAGAAELTAPGSTSADELNEFLWTYPLSARMSVARGDGARASSWEPRVRVRSASTRLPPPGPSARTLTLRWPTPARWVIVHDGRIVVEAFTWGVRPVSLALPPARYRVLRVDYRRVHERVGAYEPIRSGLQVVGARSRALVSLETGDVALTAADLEPRVLSGTVGKGAHEELRDEAAVLDLPVPEARMPATVDAPVHERRRIEAAGFGALAALPLLPASGGVRVHLVEPTSVPRLAATLVGTVGTGRTETSGTGRQWDVPYAGLSGGARLVVRDAAPITLDLGLTAGVLAGSYLTEDDARATLAFPLEAGLGGTVWARGSAEAVRVGVRVVPTAALVEEEAASGEPATARLELLGVGGLLEVGWSWRL